MSTSSDNPLLRAYELPAFDAFSADHVVPGMTALLDELDAELSELESNLEPTYDAVIRPLESISGRLQYGWGMVNHLRSVASTDELRAAHAEMQPKIVAFSIRMGQSRPIYDTLVAIQKRDGDALGGDQCRVLERLILTAHNSGVGLDGETKERFNTIQTRLAELSTQFSNHVLDATKAWSVRVTDTAEVAGLPESARALLAQNARQHDDPDATADDGPWLVTLEVASLLPVFRHAEHRPLREKVYRAYVTRASEEPNDNRPVLTEILRLRSELAELLGYANYAELSLSAKMAADVDDVLGLLENVRSVAWPAGERELEELRAFAAGSGFDGEIRPWDVSFWAERQREAQFDFTDEQVKPYFPLERVFSGLVDVVERAFGVRLVESDEVVPAWHPDVRYMHVRAADGDVIAGVYLDLFSRPADKRPGAWMGECTSRFLIRGEAGEVEIIPPIGYVTANFTPPVGDKPALLTFEEVRTLFHEFGHALQHMLTTVDERYAAGIDNVEWDAVEIPSMFMEEWLFVPAIVKRMSHHWETGDPMPDDLIDKLLSARGFRAGSMLLRQLDFGMTDIELHRQDPPADADPFAVQREVRKRTSLLDPLPEDRFLCAFSHIFAGGYAAGYYSYMWASVMAADAFGAFLEAGIDDEDAVAKVGASFRDTFLALGGSEHPAEVFRRFRGRDPDTTPMLARLGLA